MECLVAVGMVLRHSLSSEIHHKRGVIGLTYKWCFDEESW
jgi:hypothetical protein